MKPFDLEAALRGEPVVTRDGRPVTQLRHFHTADFYPLAGVLDGSVYVWEINGSATSLGSGLSRDLFMAEKPKVKQEGWVNLYKYNDGVYCCGDVYASEYKAANSTASRSLVATIRIEWEEDAE